MYQGVFQDCAVAGRHRLRQQQPGGTRGERSVKFTVRGSGKFIVAFETTPLNLPVRLAPAAAFPERARCILYPPKLTHTFTFSYRQYDWRLPLPVLEERDAYFTRAKAEIELQHELAGGQQHSAAAELQCWCRVCGLRQQGAMRSLAFTNSAN